MALQKKRKVFEDESILPDNIGKDWSNLLLSGNIIFLRSRHFSQISHVGQISCILINLELRLNFDMNSKMKIKYILLSLFRSSFRCCHYQWRSSNSCSFFSFGC